MADKKNTSILIMGVVGLASLAGGLLSIPILGKMGLLIFGGIGVAAAVVIGSMVGGDAIKGVANFFSGLFAKATGSGADAAGASQSQGAGIAGAVTTGNIIGVGGPVGAVTTVGGALLVRSWKNASPKAAYNRVLELVEEMNKPDYKPTQGDVEELKSATERGKPFIEKAGKRSWYGLRAAENKELKNQITATVNKNEAILKIELEENIRAERAGKASAAEAVDSPEMKKVAGFAPDPDAGAAETTTSKTSSEVTKPAAPTPTEPVVATEAAPRAGAASNTNETGAPKVVATESTPVNQNRISGSYPEDTASRISATQGSTAIDSITQTARGGDGHSSSTQSQGDQPNSQRYNNLDPQKVSILGVDFDASIVEIEQKNKIAAAAIESSAAPTKQPVVTAQVDIKTPDSNRGAGLAALTGASAVANLFSGNPILQMLGLGDAGATIAEIAKKTNVAGAIATPASLLSAGVETNLAAQSFAQGKELEGAYHLSRAGVDVGTGAAFTAETKTAQWALGASRIAALRLATRFVLPVAVVVEGVETGRKINILRLDLRDLHQNVQKNIDDYNARMNKKDFDEGVKERSPLHSEPISLPRLDAHFHLRPIPNIILSVRGAQMKDFSPAGVQQDAASVLDTLKTERNDLLKTFSTKYGIIGYQKDREAVQTYKGRQRMIVEIAQWTERNINRNKSYYYREGVHNFEGVKQDWELRIQRFDKLQEDIQALEAAQNAKSEMAEYAKDYAAYEVFKKDELPDMKSDVEQMRKVFASTTVPIVDTKAIDESRQTFEYVKGMVEGERNNEVLRTAQLISEWRYLDAKRQALEMQQIKLVGISGGSEVSETTRVSPSMTQNHFANIAPQLL